jgi:diguanylate cyclase (GGDEF)-like protein
MPKSWALFLGQLLLLISLDSRALQQIELGSIPTTGLDLSDQVYINRTQGLQRLEQIRALTDTSWRPLLQSDIHRIGAQDLWLTFTVTSRAAYQTRILSIDNPNLDSLVLFHLVGGQLVENIEMGDSLPFYQRPLQSNAFAYSFTLEQDQPHTFYLKINTSGSAHLPLTLWSPNQFSQAMESQSLLRGLQLGALCAFGLFALFISLTSGSFSYSYYAGYVLSMSLLVATINGLAFRYVWPNWPAVQQLMVPAILPIVVAFGIMFTEKVLQLKYHSIKMVRLCRGSAAYAVILSLISPLLDYSLAIHLDIASVLTIGILLLIMATQQALSGHKLARLYLLGWFVMLCGAISSSLSYLGYLDLGLQPHTPMMLGLTFEIIFMSAVLAIRYNDERKAKLAIQRDALAQAERARLAREDALMAESESNERLEQMVQERTLELEITLRELNEVNEKLIEQTTIDSLTGVRNRNAFDKRLQAEGRISRRQQTPMALLMLDIDKFKSINDNYGHLAGDQALRLVATCLQQQLRRPTDLVSRFGGEEFAIILPSTDEEGAWLVAEQMRHSVEAQQIAWEGKQIPLTISIGVSAAVIDSDDHPTRLLEEADRALYLAKNAGRNRVSLFTTQQETPQPELAHSH